METLSIKSDKNEYRVVTIAVNQYEDRQVVGSIHHNALEHDIGFDGWMDFMKIVNQIYDVTKAPKQTIDMRCFGHMGGQELCRRCAGEGTAHTQVHGRKATFEIFLEYRYHASWQGSITWLDGDRTYTFASFLNLLKVMDGILHEREPDNLKQNVPDCVCQIAVNQYDSNIRGELQQAAFNYRRCFSGVADLAWKLSELTADSQSRGQRPDGKLITAESLQHYREGGKEATFVVRILYREYATCQGMIYCRELKEEKSFRSFMEMMYLMASALDTRDAGRYSLDSIDQDYIEIFS